uniref:Homocysteine-responsive endoplasmic reticulum-resident ubiquitin-like domain member 2 protein n=1 Tax=Panagrolaimus sp. JU765 TaxID=591449 RepID=A0AC34QN85_9BILA
MSPITGPQNLPGYNVHFNLRQNAPQMEQQNQNNVQPQQPAPAVNDEEHLNDVVGMIYKSIRVGFFLMVLFFYSSVERFFTVFLIMCVLWFIHRRREQNNLNEAARQVVQQPQQPVQNADNPEVELNENAGEQQVNNDNNNNEVPAPPRLVNLQDGQTRWNLFWSAVSTFFLSLIPDHQVPVEVAE